ncbi:MAG: Uma2 family endonuclease [Myxococcales bacterium]|nr:Uma2 family endonuclease [Myxococcales bacterium]
MSQPPRRATYADLVAAPEDQIAELIDGVLHLSPRPRPRHARAATVLGGDLMAPFDRGRGGPGGWIVLFGPELRLGDDVLVPDLAAWRRERVPVLPDTVGIELAPDWVCEVLSPSTEKLDRRRELAVYARAGVGHAWLVDPLARTVEVLRRTPEDLWLIVGVWGDDAVVALEPFAAIEVELAAWWADVEPAPTAAP